MKSKLILIDIIHPANVHYFKYTIRKLKDNGYEVIIMARQKEVSYALLEAEKFSFIKMGRNLKSTWGKVLFLIRCEIRTFFIFLKYRPGMTLSFGASIHCS